MVRILQLRRLHRTAFGGLQTRRRERQTAGTPLIFLQGVPAAVFLQLVYVWMMRGVMKKISSWLLVLTDCRLKRFPSTGISPSSGTC